jgi:dimethylamine/trimethylamine dehydrogenase
MTLGKRGFEYVHLVDADRQLGGALRWIARLPGLSEWIRVLDYRLGQIERLSNVLLVPRKQLDVDDVLDYGGQIVIAATGSTWCGDGLNWATHRPTAGADASLDYVLTPDQLAAGKPVPGDHIAIYDCDGYFMAVSLAEQLALSGKHITVVTPFGRLAPWLDHTAEDWQMHGRLEELAVRIETGRIVEEIGPGVVTTSRFPRRDQRTTLGADAVVLITQRQSNDALFRELEVDRERLGDAGITSLLRIGDCVVPRLVADAVFDGHRLAREIDSPNPAGPLAFFRHHQEP